MKFQHYRHFCFFVILVAHGIPTAAAQMATISLVPDTESVSLGEQLTLEIMGDFMGDDTFGGGIDLSFVSDDFEFVSYIPSTAGLPVYRRDPEISAGTLSGMAFGDFNGIGSNSVLIGTITFDVPLDAPGGLSDISISASTGVAGPFASAQTFELQTVSFSGVSITVIGELLFEDGFESP